MSNVIFRNLLTFGVLILLLTEIAFVGCGVKGPPVPYVESIQPEVTSVPVQSASTATEIVPIPNPSPAPRPKSKGKKTK